MVCAERDAEKRIEGEKKEGMITERRKRRRIEDALVMISNYTHLKSRIRLHCPKSRISNRIQTGIRQHP